MPYDLAKLARQALLDRGLQPDFTAEALHQLQTIQNPASFPSNAKDLRHLLWSSIDNDDSRDLDQLTYAEKISAKETALYIAIADVDSLVPKNCPIDQCAQINTTSVYTPAKIFPMLPEKLSTNLTSLNEQEERLALVVKITVSPEGEVTDSALFHAIVKNYAKLAYSSLGGWLEGKSPLPEKIKSVSGLSENLRLQSDMAQILKKSGTP